MSTLTGSQLTFIGLFKRFSRVEIPLIQRDYAQGRKTAKDVRTGLLDSFLATVRNHEKGCEDTLDLDFIYGSITEQAQTEELVFCPLDGQQRLTTLFLLHWFAACVDNTGDQFKNVFSNNEKSRFSYLVRPSSEEFFDKLTVFLPTFQELKETKVSEILKDKSWFFLSWIQDPTIQSSLVMLDAIQEIFINISGLYKKLEDSDKPLITFQLLELEQFGLSDDLYIKMNARGKPLTVFENFKAKLEHHLSSSFPGWTERNQHLLIPVKDYFSHRIEMSWADLLWLYKDEKTKLFDEQFMNLFRSLAIVTRDPDSPDFILTIEEFRDDKNTLNYQQFEKLTCLDEPMLRTVFTFLERLSGSETGARTYLSETSYFDEIELFKRTLNRKGGLIYEDLVLLHAYSGYLLRYEEISSENLWNWMRVIRNLSRNTIYNRAEDFQRSIRAVNSLFKYADKILEHLSEATDEVAGFNEQQVREETLKAQLILKSSEWKDLIISAECHSYLAGQIEFLFKFSGLFDVWAVQKSAVWDATRDEAFREKFVSYYDKTNLIFDVNGLRLFDDFLWERALLALGDYLVDSGRSKSFLKSEGRETSWKRLLRGNPKKELDENSRLLVKKLFDQIDLSSDLSSCLQAIIDCAQVNEKWRELLVADCRFIEFCENRLMRWQTESCIYLLRTTQMNGRHVELFSYNLYLNQLKQLVDGSGLSPVTICEYKEVSDTEYEPSIELRAMLDFSDIVIRIYSCSDQIFTYKICVEWPNCLISGTASATLTDNDSDWIVTPDYPSITKSVPHNTIIDELRHIAQILWNS